MQQTLDAVDSIQPDAAAGSGGEAGLEGAQAASMLTTVPEESSGQLAAELTAVDLQRQAVLNAAAAEGSSEPGEAALACIQVMLHAVLPVPS